MGLRLATPSRRCIAVSADTCMARSRPLPEGVKQAVDSGTCGEVHYPNVSETQPHVGSAPLHAALGYVVRAGLPSDTDFIARSWALEFRASEGWVRRIEEDFVTRCIYPRIQSILSRAKVRIAGPPEDDATVYGFAVLEPALVHMVYVRRAWRRMGIATALLAGLNLGHHKWTTQTRDWLEWGRHKYQLHSYQPFWMTPGEGEWKQK